MLDWLNENAGAMQALLATVLVIITSVYYWWTREIVDASRAQLLAEAMPVVVIGLQEDGEDMTVVVRNLGKGPALSVDVQWRPTPFGEKTVNLRNRIPSNTLLSPAESAPLTFARDWIREAIVRSLYPEHATTGPIECGSFDVAYSDIYGRSGFTSVRLILAINSARDDATVYEEARIEIIESRLPTGDVKSR